MKCIVLVLSVFSLFLTACSGSIFGRKKYDQELKSPCVDNGGPCQHIPVNNWWLPSDIANFNPIYKA